MKTEELEFFLGPEHQLVAQKMAAFASDELSGLEPPHDDAAARVQARQLLASMGRSGWLGALIPGGEIPRDSRTLCLFREAVAGVSPLADATFAVQGLGTQPLILEGSAELQERYLPDALAGSLMTAFAMTEPEAGSDVGNIQTSAQESDGEYFLSGEKCLISNAGIADAYVVFASLNPSLKSRGIGAFWVLKDSPGFTFVEPQVLSAPHPLGRLRFERCPARLISREGFKLGMRTLDVLRVSVAAAACGMAGRALREALAHARARRQFGKALGEFQLIQEKLAKMAIGLDAARLLTYRAAWMKDMGRPNSQEVAMAKAFATETAQSIIDDALQILGGQGMLARHPVEHLYRSIRALRIYEGTTEVQYLIIAKGLL